MAEIFAAAPFALTAAALDQRRAWQRPQ